MDPLTIVFALVAVLAIWKLNSVLGQDLGLRGPRSKMRQPPPRPNGAAPREGHGDPGDNVVRLPDRGTPPVIAGDPQRWAASLDPQAEAGTAAGLDAVAAADPRFSAPAFLDGSRTAYEAIVTAFAAGERKTLQSLLARDVLDGFESAIREREGRHELLTTTFVSIAEAKIASASLEGRTARLGVRFLSKQISATRGPDGAIVAGSEDKVVDMNDVWSFSRETSSRDPNWKLVATQAGA